MKSIHKERERIHDYEEKYYKEKKEILHVHKEYFAVLDGIYRDYVRILFFQEYRI